MLFFIGLLASLLPLLHFRFYPGTGPTCVLLGNCARSETTMEKQITIRVLRAFLCHQRWFTLRWLLSCVGGATVTESEISNTFNTEDSWTILRDRIMRVSGMGKVCLATNPFGNCHTAMLLKKKKKNLCNL